MITDVSLKKLIKQNKIDFYQEVDQINYPIHYLAYHSDTNIIKSIPKKILFDLCEQPNLEGDTIGHISAKLNNMKLLDFVTKINPNVIYIRNNLYHSLFYYILSDTPFIKNFIKNNKIRDHLIDSQYTLIDHYILSSDISMFKYLLDNISISTHLIFTILESDADIETKINFLQLLLNKAPEFVSIINNKTYLTPLIVSAYLNNFDLMKFLLEHGADTNINYFGPENTDNPLIIAIHYKAEPMIELLLSNQIDVDIPNKYMQTALHYMWTYRIDLSISIKKMLMARVTNMNATDNQMNTILNLLIENDDWKSYDDILSKHKLDIYLKNKSGKCPLDHVLKSDLDLFYRLVELSYVYQLKKNDQPVPENPVTIENIIIREHRSYPKIKKKMYIIKLINPPITNITHFGAYTFNYICFLYYILSKYPEIKISTCDPLNYIKKTPIEFYLELIKGFEVKNPTNKVFRSMIREYLNHSPHLINHVIIWKNPETYFISPYLIDGIDRTLKKYPSTKFIIFKLSIVNPDSNHANLIIYDIDAGTIERFDPYGVVPFIDGANIDKIIGSFFMNEMSKIFRTIKYISTPELFDGPSFQIYSDERNDLNYVENDPVGFCVAWCVWYIETRVKNPSIKPSILIGKTIYQINKSVDHFKDYIRNYSNYLDQEKNILFEQAGIDKKYWYVPNLPISIYFVYINHMRNIYNDIL